VFTTTVVWENLLARITTRCERTVCAYWFRIACVYVAHMITCTETRSMVQVPALTVVAKRVSSATAVPRVKTFRGRDPPRVERGVYFCHVSCEDRGEALG